MDKYTLQAPKDTSIVSPKLSLMKRIGADGSYGGGYGSMCGKPHVVLSTSFTAFQVLQGDTDAAAAGRKRRDLSLYKGTWKPVESNQFIPDILDRADHGHGDYDIDSYGAPLAPAVSVKYQGKHQHKTTPAHTGYQPHNSGNDCPRPVVIVMPPANSRTNSGLARALLAGIPALLG